MLLKRILNIKNSKLEGRMYLAFLLLFIFLGLATSFVVGNILIKTKYTEVRFTMSLIAQNIEMRLDDAKNIVELAAKMPAVAQHDSVAAEKYLNDIIQKNPKMWSHFLITDKNGTEIAHTEGSIHYGKSLASRDYFFVPMKENRIIVAQPIHSVSTGRKIIAIGVPTIQNGKPNGVLVGFIHLGYVSELLNANDLSMNSYLFMASHDGTISAHTEEAYVLSKKLHELTADDEIISSAKALESSSKVTKVENRPGLVSSAPVESYQLSIFSFIPFLEAFMTPIIVVMALLVIFITIICLLVLWIKIEQSVAYGKEMENTANTDKLTGLKNRRLLDTININALYNESLAAIFFDIDDFKKYNDEHDHAYGDAVLRFVGQSITHSTRPNADICIRYAGDEFLILVRDTPLSNVTPIAERLMATLKSYETPEVGADPIAISCGIAYAQKDEMSLAELVATADKAAMNAKRNGKDRIVIA